jgi:putative ATP-dependent endonuclease of OLD family
VALHISRIEIQNFRNFGHLILDPFPARAVIVGENGAGKSNLLDALRLVLDPSLPDTARMLRTEDIWEGHTGGIPAGVVVTIAIELSGYDADDDAKAVLSSCMVDTAPYRARLTYRFAPRAGVAVTADDGATQLIADDRPLTVQDYDFQVFGGREPSNDMRRVRRDIAIRVLHALRDAETDLQNWRRNPLRELLERLPLDPANLQTTADAVAAAVAQLRTDPNVTKLQTHLADRLGDMTGPRMPLDPTLGFASSQPDELIRSVRLFVDAHMRRSVAETSLGSANVLYLALLIEALEHQRIEDLVVATILAVEEPEAHLHVSLQRRLFSYLLRREAALLLTTHSPHIAAVAPLDTYVLLRQTEQGTIGRTSAALVLTANQAQDLERYLDVTRAEILFASAVILVEGIAEVYILPALAEALRFDLDSYGVVVSSVHGTDFAPYRELLGSDGLDIPHVIVTDGDAAEDARGVREAGLKRAAKLITDPDRASELADEIKALPDADAADYLDARGPLVLELASHDVFVGRQTLEVDMCTMFSDELRDSFAELVAGRRTRGRFDSGVDNELSDRPDPDVRAGMLNRISAVGKGRVAQRLASHIETADVAGRMRSDLGLGDGERTAADWADAGPGAHLLSALDEISRGVRGRPLLGDD